MVVQKSMIDRLTPSKEITLTTCNDCGLEFFDPLVPGDRAFYEWLAAAGYQEATRWEFDEVANRMRRGEDVIDIGCGNGAFLARVSGIAGRRVGVDLAVERNVAGPYVEIFEGTPDAYVESVDGVFDVVTAFHILEHVVDAREICVPARRLLKPGGTFFISVPDAERPVISKLEPLDLPPHHVSRWRTPQLERLGGRFGLVLERVDHVPSRVYPRWLDGVPRPIALTVAAAYHSIKGAQVRFRKLFSDESGDALLAQYERPK